MYSEYIKKLDEAIQENKNKIIKESCCDMTEIYNGICYNCGLVKEENNLITIETDYLMTIEYTTIVGNSKSFYKLKKFHLFSNYNYFNLTIKNKIKPLIYEILIFNDIYNAKLFYRTINLYKDYYTKNKSKRGKVKTLLILYLVHLNNNINVNINISKYNISINNVHNLKKCEILNDYNDEQKVFIKLCLKHFKKKKT